MPKAILLLSTSLSLLLSLGKSVACLDETDCSLAGECRDGTCVCDGWTHGLYCEQLNLEPVDSTLFGYRNASGYNSWGGASVHWTTDQGGDGKWYLFTSQMQGRCTLLGHWSTLSQVVRSASDAGPSGPFLDATVVVPSFAHNAKPFLSPDGTWLIFYIGEINNISHTCSNGTSIGTASAALGAAAAAAPAPKSTAGPIMIASATRPDAPASQWCLHGPITDSVQWHTATNPSPVFNATDGTVRLAVSRSWGGWKRTVIMEAPSWRGPYTNVSATATYTGSINSGEDPDLFRTARGW
jgi:hypothetical protein